MIGILISLFVVFVAIKILAYLRDVFQDDDEQEIIQEAKDWLSHLEIGTPVDMWTPPIQFKNVFVCEIQDGNIIHSVDGDHRWSFIEYNGIVTGINYQ